jgi:hypothetical protein
VRSPIIIGVLTSCSLDASARKLAGKDDTTFSAGPI